MTRELELELYRRIEELQTALKEAIESHLRGIPYGAVPKWKAVLENKKERAAQ